MAKEREARLVLTECRTIGAIGVFTWKLRQAEGDTDAKAIKDAGEHWRVAGYETRGGRIYTPPTPRKTR